jgi:hypothetical protein
MYTQNYNDALNDPENKDKYERLQLPTRVVMNNQTLTVFTGDHYDNQVMSFNLRDTNFKRQPTQPGCFLLYNPVNQKAELCPYAGSSEAKAILEEWDYDFNLFKNQCNTKKEKTTEASLVPEELKKRLDDKMVNSSNYI